MLLYGSAQQLFQIPKRHLGVQHSVPTTSLGIPLLVLTSTLVGKISCHKWGVIIHVMCYIFLYLNLISIWVPSVLTGENIIRFSSQPVLLLPLWVQWSPKGCENAGHPAGSACSGTCRADCGCCQSTPHFQPLLHASPDCVSAESWSLWIPQQVCFCSHTFLGTLKFMLSTLSN